MSSKDNKVPTPQDQANKGQQQQGSSTKGGGGGRRSRGRRRGGSSHSKKESNHQDETSTTSNNNNNNDDDDEDETWLVQALQALGAHDDDDEKKNPSWRHALNNDDDDDDQFVPMTLWLEDRFIRQYKREQRQEQLYTHFWQHIDNYLLRLNIPRAYLGFKNSDGSSSSSWRTQPHLRCRVIQWLISIATLELYGDRFVVQVKKEREETTKLESLMLSDNNNNAIAKSFPLGFSTGDPQVDRILTVLRMNLLLDLEREQREINQSIAQLQQQTIPNAKPLKQQGRRRRR